MNKSYNTDAPEVSRRPLWLDVELGWQHTIEGDELVFVIGPDGSPMPKVWRFPATLTAQDLQRASKVVTPERIQELAVEGGMDAAVELVGAVAGHEMVIEMATDPTVSPEGFAVAIIDVVISWGLVEALPGDDPANFTQPPPAVSSDSATA